MWIRLTRKQGAWYELQVDVTDFSSSPLLFLSSVVSSSRRRQLPSPIPYLSCCLSTISLLLLCPTPALSHLLYLCILSISITAELLPSSSLHLLILSTLLFILLSVLWPLASLRTAFSFTYFLSFLFFTFLSHFSQSKHILAVLPFIFLSPPSLPSATDGQTKIDKVEKKPVFTKGHQYLHPKCTCTCSSAAALAQGSSAQCQGEFIAVQLLNIKTV